MILRGCFWVVHLRWVRPFGFAGSCFNGVGYYLRCSRFDLTANATLTGDVLCEIVNVNF